MESIFVYDATPTWSGFVYQGEVAIYLAVKKICELRDKEKLGIDEIGGDYQVEIEYFEDIAIVKAHGKDEQYLSIHQVKNQQDRNINSYKVPLIQLMLEKGLCEKKTSTDLEVYLHISNEIVEDKTTIDNNLEKWKISIQKYHKDLANFVDNTINGDDKDFIIQEIYRIIENDPIKLNRKKYSNLVKKIKKIYQDKNFDIEELKNQANKLLDFLDEELAVNFINDKVMLYEYEDKKVYCEGKSIFNKIVEQVKKYKNDTTSSNEEYVCIADKLLHLMRTHIIERHQKMQKKENFEKRISFHEIIGILDGGLTAYDTEANILALRRKFDETLSKYCMVICKNQCEGLENSKCALKDTKYTRTELEDDDYVKMCYAYYPECDKKIKERECIGKLLIEPGLSGSVFEVLRKIPKEFFVNEEEQTRFVIDDENSNAFLTGIVGVSSDMVVDNIIDAINNNTELISQIFMADELITFNIKSEKEVWDNYYTRISEKYISMESKKSSDNTEYNICEPKKPKFVEAKTIINKYFKC